MLGNEIDLVERHHQRDLEHCQLGVEPLLRGANAMRGIEQRHENIGAAGRLDGLQLFRFPDGPHGVRPRRVHQVEKSRVRRLRPPRGPRHGAHLRLFRWLPHQLVVEGGFAGIRRADDRHPALVSDRNLEVVSCPGKQTAPALQIVRQHLQRSAESIPGTLTRQRLEVLWGLWRLGVGVLTRFRHHLPPPISGCAGTPAPTLSCG